MSKAVSLLAVALVGLTLASGMASADLLPPLPPMPTLPSYPDAPGLPTDGLPVATDACMAMANEVGLASSQSLTEIRDGSVGALGHQSDLAQGILDGSGEALAIDDIVGQASGVYEAGIIALNYTLPNTAAAVNFTRDGLAPAVDRSLNGSANATNSLATSSLGMANDTLVWGQATFRYNWDSNLRLVDGTFTDAVHDRDHLLTRWTEWAAFVQAGPQFPAASLYASLGQAQANSTDAAGGVYAVPMVGAQAIEMALGSANNYLHAVAGVAVHPQAPEGLSELAQGSAGTMTAAAQTDIGALQGSAGGYSGFVSGWVLAAPGRGQECAQSTL